MIYQGDTPLPGTPEWEALSAEEQQAVYAGYQAMRPPETATTVRVQDGRTLPTDGPFAETKEALGGYCFLEADDEQAAIELAAKVPAAAMGGAVEVRALVER